jgi:hypothetical protein
MALFQFIRHFMVCKVLWLVLYKELARRMPSSGMLRRVALVTTDVSEQRTTSIIRVTAISELGKCFGC